MHIVVIDIEEQPEVIQFSQEGIEWLQSRNSTENFKLSEYKLRSKQRESLYDFSPVKEVLNIDLVLLHTKTLINENGVFRDKLWLLELLKSFQFNASSKLIFYSGNISDFNSWLQEHVGHDEFGNIPNLSEVITKDVFELLYPTNFDSFELWLEDEYKKAKNYGSSSF